MEHLHQFIARFWHFLHTGEDRMRHTLSEKCKKENLSRIYHGGHVFYFGAVVMEAHGSLVFIAGGMALMALVTLLLHAYGD